MEISESFKRVEELMEAQYGVSVFDYLSEDKVRQALMDSEEPQAIVDEVANDAGLKRIEGSLAETHIDSLVKDWRELMEQILGKEEADMVTDQDIRVWLVSGQEPPSRKKLIADFLDESDEE